MTASVTHQKVSTIPPTSDATLVSSDDWNDTHVVSITAADINAAPNSGVDYAVGTATGLLAGEIVIGTTPQGELGGTWGAVTIDSVHSGSSHAGVVATHEGAVDPHTGYVREDLIDAAGDLYVGSADNTVARLPKGTALQYLRVNSGATALEYATLAANTTVATDTIFDAAGDLAVGSGADTAVRLARGSALQYLRVNAAGTNLEYATLASTTTVATDTIFDAAGDLAVGTGADTSAKLAKGAAGQFLQAGASTLAYAEVFTIVPFAHSGACATATGVFRWYNDTGRTLTFASARASVDTAPTGATLIVDVNVDGTTVFSTQGNRPTIAISGNTNKTTTFNTTTIADGHYITVDIDQIGSTIAGSDLTVVIYLKG